MVAHGLERGEPGDRGRPPPARRRGSPAWGRACPARARAYSANDAVADAVRPRRPARTRSRPRRRPRPSRRRSGRGWRLRPADAEARERGSGYGQAGHHVPGAPVHAGRAHAHEDLVRRRSSAGRPRRVRSTSSGAGPYSSWTIAVIVCIRTAADGWSTGCCAAWDDLPRPLRDRRPMGDGVSSRGGSPLRCFSPAVTSPVPRPYSDRKGREEQMSWTRADGHRERSRHPMTGKRRLRLSAVRLRCMRLVTRR